MIKVSKKSTIAFVGGGKPCKELLKIILSKPFAPRRPTVLGVADPNEQAESTMICER